jgi:phosphoglycerol transferase MdoB-like AlkP superfamily enzyme
MRRRIPRFFESAFVYLLFFPVSIIYLETVARVACFGWKAGFSLYVLLFSLVIGMFCTLLSGLFGLRGNRFVSTLLLVLATVAVYGQTLYYTIFRTFMQLSSITMAGDVTGYWRELLVGVWHSFVPLLLMLLPLILWRRFAIRSLPDERLPLVVILILLGASVLSHFVVAALVKGNTQGIMSASYLYSDSFIPDLAADRFGILTTMRLDAKNLFFGNDEDMSTDEPIPSGSAEPSEEPSEEPVVYGENAMDIDFDSLIANTTNETLLSMHKYFAAQSATKKNEYTGLWKGKNLIWICAEGFSRYALNETATPTLCRLAKEGIVCTNFYNPVWSVSTSDGEYVQLTGLLPKSGVRSFARSADKPNLMYFTMGIQLSTLGYDARAYHNHTYNYYGRDKSHPNMGYIYKALGSGLDAKKPGRSPTWR